jgi:hypothetical protein
MTALIICASLLGLIALVLIAVAIYEKTRETRTEMLRVRLEAMKAAQRLSAMAWETRQAMHESVRDYLRSHM